MDFMLDDDGDLDMSSGDLRVDNNDLGHIESILLAHKGEYKQFPIIGVGVASFINAPITPSVRITLEREIRLQLESDRFKNIHVKVDADGGIDINANKNE